ncbi:MAG: hypothetical protein ACPG4Y_08710 [Chitinophagales bacterium]
MEMKWISIAVAALAAVILAYVWNNIIFEDMAQEKNEHRLPNAMYFPLAYIFSFFIAMGLWNQIIGLHGFIKMLKESAAEITEYPFAHGALHGVQSSFFYGVISVLVLTALLNGKGFKWIFVTVSYWVLAMALMGGIIGAMG